MLVVSYVALVHKVMYTTNAIEAFHCRLRWVIKTKGSLLYS